MDSTDAIFISFFVGHFRINARLSITHKKVTIRISFPNKRKEVVSAFSKIIYGVNKNAP